MFKFSTILWPICSFTHKLQTLYCDEQLLFEFIFCLLTVWYYCTPYRVVYHINTIQYLIKGAFAKPLMQGRKRSQICHLFLTKFLENNGRYRQVEWKHFTARLLWQILLWYVITYFICRACGKDIFTIGIKWQTVDFCSMSIHCVTWLRCTLRSGIPSTIYNNKSLLIQQIYNNITKYLRSNKKYWVHNQN